MKGLFNAFVIAIVGLTLAGCASTSAQMDAYDSRPLPVADDLVTGSAGYEHEPVSCIAEDEVLSDEENHPALVEFHSTVEPGTLIVYTGECAAYLVFNNYQAGRIRVAVGKEGMEWSGTAVIGNKVENPTWTPPEEMIGRKPELAKWAGGMPPGPDNPLGTRALYLYQDGVDTLYRIHGTNDASSIGKKVSSGCIRVHPLVIESLFDELQIGTKIIVL